MKCLILSLVASSVFAIFGCGSGEKEKVIYIDREVIVEVPVETEASGDEGSESSNENNNENSGNTTTENSAALTDVSLQGSLAVSGAGALAIGLNLLADDPYVLYCTTFEDTPLACSITVGSDGNYNATCENFAGKSFGCFLRQGETTLTTVEFDGDTSLVAGAGTLKSSINYDAKAKLATAKIDEESSTALDSSAIEAAKKAAGVTNTNISDITGSWKIACVDAPEEGMYCDPTDDPNYVDLSVKCDPANKNNASDFDPWSDPECFDHLYSHDTAAGVGNGQTGGTATARNNIPKFVFLDQFTSGDSKKVAVWKSQTRKEQCVPSNTGFTEDNPAIGLKFDSTLYPYNLSTKDTLLNSIDDAVDQLFDAGGDGKDLIERLVATARARESWQVDQCVRNPFDNATNCKLRLEEIETWTYFDYETGKENTESYTRSWMNVADFGFWPDEDPAIAAGDLTVETVQCTFDVTDGSGKPFCPPHATSSGTYREYYKKNAKGQRQKLQLVCKHPDGWLQQWVASSNNRDQAVSDMSSKNDKCNVTADWDASDSGHPYDGLYGVEVDAVRRSILELTNSGAFFKDSSEICRGLDSSDINSQPWTFATCDSPDFTWQNPNPGESICWGRHDLEHQLGLKLDHVESNPTYGHFIEDTNWDSSSITFYDETFLKLSCPGIYKIYKLQSALGAVSSSWEDGYLSFEDALLNKCRDKFASDPLDTVMNNSQKLEKQITLAKKLSTRWDFPLRAIACSDGGTLKNKVISAVENSCMADANYSMFCDMNGNCMNSLRCNGSGAKGKCYRDGKFIGNIVGRMGVMDLKLRVGGAFELSETKKDQWTQYNWTENKNENCEMSRTTIINARSKETGEITKFGSVFKTKEEEQCSGNGTCSDAQYKNQTDCEAASEVWTEETNKGTNQNQNTDGGGMQMDFERQALSDVFNRLNFSKCSNTNCSGEL